MTVGALVAVFAVVIGVTALAAPVVAPSSQHSMTIVSDPQVPIGSGVDNGVVFGFQPAPAATTDDPLVPSITQATVTGTVTASCGSSTCSPVIVEILTNDQLTQLQATGATPAVWCYGSGSACVATQSAHFSVDVTSYADTPLSLVVFVPGSGPASTFSISATLTWQS